MQRPQRIHLEVEKRDGGRAVVRGLRRGMHDQVGTDLADQLQNAVAVANVERGMPIPGDLLAQSGEGPRGIAFRAEEHRAVVAVDSVNLKTRPAEVTAYLGAD